MNFSKAMLNNAFKLIIAALVAALALRSVSMRFFFDYSTGFYTDSGLTAWLSLLIPLTLVGAAALFCKTGLPSLGSYQLRRSPVLAVFAALSGAVLVVSALTMAKDYMLFLDSGFSQFDSVRQGFNHQLYMIASFLLGLAQLAVAGALLSGKDIFKKLSLLYMVAVVWGASNMVMVYVFYAKSSSVAENIFSMGGAAALLLSLLYLCRLLAGVEAQGAGLRLFLWGGVAAVLAIPYYGVDLIQRALGYVYAGEVPPQCQLSGLAMGVFVLAFLASVQKRGHEAGEPAGQHYKEQDE